MRITKSILENKCADVNYLRGSLKPFAKIEGNYYVDKTEVLNYSVVEVMSEINGYSGVHRIRYDMSAAECYMFLIGIEYAIENCKGDSER